jgi:hypothetical protein
MKKRLLALVLVAIVLVGTGFAFSYWDNLQVQQSETITVGEGTDLTVSAVAEAEAGKVLVPAGTVMKANDLDEIVLTYNVVLDQTVNTALNLTVTSSNVLVGGVSTYAGLVNIDISQAAATVNDSNVLVTVTITLDEPADATEYAGVANAAITFDLTFTATQPA